MHFADIQMSTAQWIFFAIGQLSFLVGALGFRVTNLIKLRGYMLVSQILGVIANIFLVVESTETFAIVSLSLVVFWLLAYFSVNAWQFYVMVRNAMEVPLTEEETTLAALAFPRMKSRDIKLMLSMAKVRTYEPDTVVLKRTQNTDALTLLSSGSFVESLPSGERWMLRRGSMLGDVSYLLGDQYGGSPGDILAQQLTLAYEWDYQTLKKTSDKNPELASALSDGIARGFAKKRRLLGFSDHMSQAVDSLNAPLSLLQKGVHTALFPYLTENEFHVFWEAAGPLDLNPGDSFNPDLGLACICSGEMRFESDDGFTVVLPRLSLIGEFGLLAPDRPNRSSKHVVASAKSLLMFWTPEAIDSFAVLAPQLHTHLMKSLGRDVVLKTQADGYRRPLPRLIPKVIAEA